jgi:uncharacterized protein YndB with AHSA1/START domain
MTQSGRLDIATPTDREIVITRVFQAPRRLVFDAFTRPELLKRWLFGPDGWSLDVCEVDLRPGGRYRYVWRRERTNAEMGAGGVFLEVAPPERIVATERFDDAWYPGESVGTIVLAEASGRTTLTQTLRYESREARDIALKSGMEDGLKAGYDRIESVLAGMQAAG